MSVLTTSELYSHYLGSSKVETDSRTAGPGDLFFALKGPHFDGHDHVMEALDKGASYAVVDRSWEGDHPLALRVNHTEKALQDLSRYHRRQWGGKVLAITGSNGKTTTKELVDRVLSQQFPTQATLGNRNNHIGVPLTLLALKPETAFAVVEMGANHRGEIAAYCQWAEPDYGLITNCGKAHLEGFGSEEGVRQAKGELFDALRQRGGRVFLHSDLGYLREMARGIPDPITYGQGGDAQYRARPLSTDLYLSLVLLNRDRERRLDTQLVGSYNFGNVMAAYAIGLHFGISLDKVCEAISAYQPGNSRSQFLQKGGHQVVLDAYNANPSSMELAIRNFARWEGLPKVLLLGSMKELGTVSRKEHEKLVEQALAHPWAAVVFVGREYEEIPKARPWFETAEQALDHVRDLARSPGAFLIKGSRANRMEILLNAL